MQAKYWRIIKSKVNNCGKRGNPPDDAELDKAVFDQCFRGAAATVQYKHVLQVAQKASNNPDACQIEVVGSHTFNDTVTHGVHNVTYDGNGGDNGDTKVDELCVIADNAFAWHHPSLFEDAVVVLSFGKGEE